MSYKFIETPTRKYLSKISLVKAYSLFIVIVAIISAVSFYIFKNDGFKHRFNDNIVKVLDVKNDRNKARKKECFAQNQQEPYKCQYGNHPIKLLVIGDSHTFYSTKGIYQSLPKNSSMITWTKAWCSPIENLIIQNDYSCGTKVSKLINEIDTKYTNTPILIISRINTIFNGVNGEIPTSRYITKAHKAYDQAYIDEMTDAYVETLGKLAKHHPVYVTRPTPEASYSVPDKVAKMMWLKKQDKVDLSIPLSDYQKRSYYAWRAQDIAHQKYGIHIIDVSKVFCDKQRCYFTKDGIPLFFDDNHMTQNGSLILTPLFKKEIFGQQ